MAACLQLGRHMRCPSLGLLAASIASIAAAACTTLGPVPTSTTVSPIAHGRPGVDLQAGAMPGFYVSSTTRESDHGDAFAAISALLEPDRMLGLKGLIVGGTMIGGDGGSRGMFQPYVGWRGYVDAARTASVAAVAFGSSASDGNRDGRAHVDVQRVGAEVTGDYDVTQGSRVVGFHVLGGASVQRLDASGDYCVDSRGDGTDCGDTDPLTHAEVDALITSGRGGLALDFARDRDSWFHGGRVEFSYVVGSKPRVVFGQEQGSQIYSSGSLTLTLGFGE